jgi:plasmid stabilization system protein ParE
MPRAKRQANAISAWWKRERLEAPSQFDDELDRILATLAEHPERGFRLEGPLRGVLMAASRYIVAYRVRPRARCVEVVAIRGPR